MSNTSKSPLRDLLLNVISQLPMRSTTAAQLRAITGLDPNRISFSLHSWVADGYLVSVGDYGRRYFRAQADALNWAANPVEPPLDPGLAERLSTQCRAELQNVTRSRVSSTISKGLPPRASRPATAEERQQEAERRAQQRNAQQRNAQRREQEGNRAKPRINYRHRIGSTAVAPAHTSVAMPAPVTVTTCNGDDRPVIIPPNVRITRAPLGLGRYEAAGPVIGGFATLPLGQYLDEAGFSKYLETNA